MSAKPSPEWLPLEEKLSSKTRLMRRGFYSISVHKLFSFAFLCLILHFIRRLWRATSRKAWEVNGKFYYKNTCKMRI